MDKYPAHKLANVCQRMPLDVYVMVLPNAFNSEESTTPLAIRAVKSELVKTLKEMDGRTKVAAALTLEAIYVEF